ncbi:hypothetical protein Pmar_PMAR014776 [Perkinsus marinus ATCC 50983]|uniref:Uncharacterized protein n=1 Tax=Perkinsus marinus (strain ATCC 50983 / TXsc) TaxID=423536 RepID=C5KPJ7_PERM5|nr:hypothetical protein Pmar_PMAR014776 [Perkinsus marinus ATCC 50983]EER13595.1 hypothetical protein Pmar_PMAR014776 [Perkinsus marinus ATCC 50983]|eukprot:XP_002781800.1 hypothetical protein Pmar_PMAR014776 [Perkinsus marinus ATCC 50983]
MTATAATAGSQDNVWKARGEGDDENDGSDEWRSLKQATDLIHDMDTLNNNDDNNNKEEDILSQRLPLDKY